MVSEVARQFMEFREGSKVVIAHPRGDVADLAGETGTVVGIGAFPRGILVRYGSCVLPSGFYADELALIPPRPPTVPPGLRNGVFEGVV